MKKLLYAIVLGIIPSLSHAFTPLRYVQISTNSISQQSGSFNVAGGQASTMTVTSSGTFRGAVHIASTVVDGSNSQGSTGQSLQSNAGSAPTWVNVPATILATTSTWTAAQTFGGKLILSSTVIDGSSVQGTSGQSLQSNAGSVPTWVNVPSAILSTTSTWTASQTFSTITLNNLTPTNIVGVTAATPALPGTYGEMLSSCTLVTALVTSPASGQLFDIVALPLGPGDFNVWGGAAETTVTAITDFQVGISSVQGNTSNSVGNLRQGDNLFSVNISTAPAQHDAQGIVPIIQVLQGSTTTYYLKARLTFSSGTAQAYGCIKARRVR